MNNVTVCYQSNLAKRHREGDFEAVMLEDLEIFLAILIATTHQMHHMG